MKEFYESNKYRELNPDYHVEDSEFKSKNFMDILKKNNFEFQKVKNIIDVGCGAGKILKTMQETKLFNEKTKFCGFDFNKTIIDLANKESNENLNFYNSDFFKTDLYKSADLILCADVYEHIEDYIGFLKKLLIGGKFFLFNIPLDISFRSILFSKVIQKNFQKVGHIHFFNKNIAKILLEYCNYKIISTAYAKNYLEMKNKSIKQKILSVPIKTVDFINEDLSATLFGGYSLIVLAKS